MRACAQEHPTHGPGEAEPAKEPPRANTRTPWVRLCWSSLAGAIGILGMTACSSTVGHAPDGTGAACRGPAAGGYGLLAGTVTINSAGQIVGLDPSSHPFYTPEPGDADLPLVPGTILVVRGGQPSSSDTHVLAPWADWATHLQPGDSAFYARNAGCASLSLGPGRAILVAVRSPVG